jgi:hypothetical protein
MDDKGLPKVVKINSKMSKRWGTGTVVIPAPREIDEIMRKVPRGKVITINRIREILAERHGATIGCPITTGIFAWVAAHAAEEKARKGEKDTTPYARAKLAENKIITGTVFMPILPFIYDDEENIEAVVKKTKECGGQYVLDGGLTLWGYCKTHFYKTLKKYNPTLIREYEKLYRDQKLLAEYTGRVHRLVVEGCEKHCLTPYSSTR